MNAAVGLFGRRQADCCIDIDEELRCEGWFGRTAVSRAERPTRFSSRTAQHDRDHLLFRETRFALLSPSRESVSQRNSLSEIPGAGPAGDDFSLLLRWFEELLRAL